MIYWTDFEASTVVSQALVNNLDLKVVTPAGDTVLPWLLDPTPNSVNLSLPAVRGIDNLNNMEQVLIDTVTAGTYTLLVNGKTIPQGPQKYFILWETREDNIEITHPVGRESFTPGTVETIRWDAISSGNTTIEYSLDNGVNWNLIGVNTNSSLKYRDWFVPDTISGNALIRVTNGSIVGQSPNTFSIIRTPSNISTSFTCSDSIGLTWDSVPYATEYEISVMGTKYMDSIGRSSSTNFTLKNITLSDDNWVSVKALGNGIEGKRAIAILMPKTIEFCYNEDAEFLGITVPSSNVILNCSNTTTPVSTVIFNNGTDTIRDLPVQLRYGSNVVFDTVSAAIPSNSSYTFTFKDSIDLSSFSTVTLTVRNNSPTDSNPDNDSTSKSYTVLNSLQSLPYTEDFESFSLCATTTNCGATICNLSNGWLNANDDDFDLRTNFGTTASAGTGPSLDHNPGNASGKYLYSEASNGCTNSNSITTSPCFDLRNTINPEFKFWYHMNGVSIGSMRVDVFANGVWNLNATPIFGGNQGNVWKSKTINMSSYVGQIVNIRFQVRTGNGWESDIAIDDITFIDQATGLDDNLISSNFKIYPNPSTGIFTIQFDEIPKSKVQVLDISGRVIEVLRIESSINQVDLSSYAKGVYFLNVENTGIKEKLVIY
ncbi:MAG: T9SS type A sorting domain-containing protein [Flavobacteriales bacterium]|nr:T9SS type A sorting domain-containing protein [Flavobacteriales bacterium]